MRFSLLTIIIAASLVLLILKISNIFSQYSVLSVLNPIASAHAKENKEQTNKEDDTDADPENDATEQTDGTDEAENTANNKIEYTPTELDILQRLADRRTELVQWENDLEIKESVLRITQEKIDGKITELRSLKTQIETILEQYNAKESKKIQSLVKIYENMKPKSAAEIFSQLDMTTLLSVVEKMKEDKVALILAKMKPRLAKELTITFAQRGRLVPPSETAN